VGHQALAVEDWIQATTNADQIRRARYFSDISQGDGISKHLYTNVNKEGAVEIWHPNLSAHEFHMILSDT
jgi:hypothetical protein